MYINVLKWLHSCSKSSLASVFFTRAHAHAHTHTHTNQQQTSREEKAKEKKREKKMNLKGGELKEKTGEEVGP